LFNVYNYVVSSGTCHHPLYSK